MPRNGRFCISDHLPQPTWCRQSVASTYGQQAVESTFGQQAVESTYGQQAVESTYPYGQQAVESTYGQQAVKSTYGQQAVESTYGQQAVKSTYGQQAVISMSQKASCFPALIQSYNVVIIAGWFPQLMRQKALLECMWWRMQCGSRGSSNFNGFEFSGHAADWLAVEDINYVNN